MLRLTTLKKVKRAYLNFLCGPLRDIINFHSIKPLTPYLKNKIVLDLGCGDGYWSIALAKVAKHVYAIDQEKYFVNSAKTFSRKRNISYIVGDACAIPFNKCFDFIWCSQVIEHVHDDRKVFQEMKRVLKPEGLIFITTTYAPLWNSEEFRKLAKDLGHLRIGYSIPELEKIAKSNKLKILQFSFELQYITFFKLMYKLPKIFAIGLAPITYVFSYLAELMKQNKKGLVIKGLVKQRIR